MEIISLSCPNCGAPVSTRQNNCEYCQSPVIITSFTNIADMPLPQISKYADSYKKTLAENPDSQDLNLSIGIFPYTTLFRSAEDIRKGICLIRKSDGR